MKYVDVKVTCWQRFHFNDETNVEEIVKNLEYPFDICDLDGFKESEILYETTTPLSTKENGGFPTIEVFVGDYFQEKIWDNVNKYDV